MRIIALLMVVLSLFTGCNIVEIEGKPEEKGMFNTKYIPMWNVQKKDVWTENIENRMLNISTAYDGIQKAFSDYISDGYIFYDLSLEGGHYHLSGKTPGKYLCGWQAMEPAYLETPDTGTAQAGANTSITLAAGASAFDDYYNGMVVQLTGGTGNGQFNVISDYDGTTKVATVATWTINPDATSVYKIGGYDHVGDVEITIHTDVVSMGVKISEYGVIEKHGLELQIWLTGTIENKFTICYMNYSNYLGVSVAGINIINCYITIHGVDAVYYYSNIKNCYTKVTETDGRLSFVFNSSNSFYNNIFIGDNEINNYINLQTPSGYTISNCLFKNFKNTDGYIQMYTTAGIHSVNLNNIYFNNCNIKLNDVEISRENQIYWHNSEIIDGNIINANFITTNIEELQFYEGVPALQLTDIQDTDNYTILGAVFTPKRTTIRGTNGKITRNYLQIDFKEDVSVDDDLKYFSDDDMLIQHNTEIEETLIPTAGALKMINLTLYENDGVTPATFRSSDSFLLIAEDADSNEVVFAYHRNRWYPTMFTDIWDNITYTIKFVFVIYEPPTDISVRNLMITTVDSEMSGSAQYQNVTSKVIIP